MSDQHVATRFYYRIDVKSTPTYLINLTYAKLQPEKAQPKSTDSFSHTSWIWDHIYRGSLSDSGVWVNRLSSICCTVQTAHNIYSITVALRALVISTYK